jgi:hypothetical protein
MIELAFTMVSDFNKKKIYASADDTIPAVLYAVCQAGLRYAFSTEKFIEIFAKANDIDKAAQ